MWLLLLCGSWQMMHSEVEAISSHVRGGHGRICMRTQSLMHPVQGLIVSTLVLSVMVIVDIGVGCERGKLG
jgi:hypothetical protein